MSTEENIGVIGGGDGVPPSEAETRCQELAAEAQVPRGFLSFIRRLSSFILSSSTPPQNSDLRVDLSRGLQGEINSSNPFNLKNQDTAKTFSKKRCKNFLSNLKISKIKFASKLNVCREVSRTFFSMVPSTYLFGTEWYFSLTSPSTPRNRVNGVVILNKNLKKSIIYLLSSLSKSFRNNYVSKNTIKKSITKSILTLIHNIELLNIRPSGQFEYSKPNFFLSNVYFKKPPRRSMTEMRGTSKPNQIIIPPHITDPKLKAKYLDDQRRKLEKEKEERKKRKREEEQKKADEEEKRLKEDEALKQQQLDAKQQQQQQQQQLAAQQQQQQLQQQQLAAKQQQQLLLDQQKQQQIQDDIDKKLKDAREASSSAPKNTDDDDDSSSVASDEVDSEWEKEISDRKERHNNQKKLKKTYAQASKDGITVCVKHSVKGEIISNDDFGQLEAGITRILDKAYREKKDVGITGGGIINGRAWYPVKNLATKELLEREIPDISPPEGKTHRYIIGDQDDTPKLYSCYVKRTLWEQRDVLEERLVRYTDILKLPVIEEDGTERQAHVKIKVSGVDKQAEVQGDGFVVKVELDPSVVTKLIEESERGMEGRVKFGAVSSTELQGHGVEARIKAKQEAIELEIKKKKERREKIREKRRKKFLERHQTHNN